ncbi:patatin-like phospholipase family protein [Henriciella litoralis]|uniref:patatin-like phospholipase family protein n=1 Tax=Henriciella litoralis TaxID=568102 RepID=UPI000A031574|nr:patatin-like phospholipase family protein [Henriciella litoralis]
MMIHRIVLLVAVTFLAVACTTISVDRVPVPAELSDDVVVSGFDRTIRYWGDAAPPQTLTSPLADKPFLKSHAAEIEDGSPVELSFLVVSGGGEYGAYGAGLLNGWSASGTRPEFQVVTGVSTGALIAPFAFLGETYDDALRVAYTEVTPSEIYTPKILENILTGSALSDSTPLGNMIEANITPDVLRDIATEHRAGRRLFVSTTELDTGRPVVWDMGAIASHGGPEALALFREVIRASASVPAAFPPVPIEVSVGQNVYSELHADGSVAASLFAYGPQVDVSEILESAPADIRMTVYVIKNGRRLPLHSETGPRWYEVAGRSVALLLHYSSQSSISEIYSLTQRDGLDFRLAYIPQTFTETSKRPFEQTYMRKLYAIGEEQAREGYDWQLSPW